MKKYLLLIFLPIIFFSVVAMASLTPPDNTPAPTMYTLEDLYNLIHSDTVTTEGDHVLNPSVQTDTLSSYSVSQIYADLANLIQRENIETGTTYLGITGDFDNPDPDRPNTEVISSSLTPINSAGDSTGYNLEDIWNLINNTTTTAGAHSATPDTTPASTMHSLTEIYETLRDLIDPAKVRFGVSYLGQIGLLGGPDGLVFHWLFDGDATDSEGDNDGDITGAAPATGIGGSASTAYIFDGVDDYIDSQNILPITSSSSRSYSFWIYAGDDEREQFVLGTYGGGVRGSFNVFFNTTNHPNNIYVHTSHSDVSTYDDVVTRNAWHHIAVTYDGGIIEDDIKIYVDGVNQSVYLNGDPGCYVDTTPGIFRVGLASDIDEGRYFEGKLDDIRVYNKALTAQEVQDIYDADAPAPTGLVAYWPLDGDANDAEGNNDMTAYGGATLTMGTKGVADTAYLFDGVDDGLISNTDANLLGVNNNLTVSVWVKPGATQGSYVDIFDTHHGDGHNFVIQQDNENTNSFYFAIRAGDNNGGDGGGGVYQGESKTTQLTADVWQHLVIVKNGTSLDHYLNGVKQGETLTVVEDVYKVIQPFSIGSVSGGTERFFNGSIDEVRIYNEALTESEIQALYTQDAPPPPEP